MTMEPVGLAVGIAGLAGILSTCLDVIERVDIYKDFDRDSRSLAVQLDAEKLRLKKWACDVGFRQGKLSNDHHTALNDPQVRLMAVELLSVIKAICGDVTTSELGLDENLATVTRGIQSLPKSSESRRQKLVWSLRGKARRTSQVENLGVLVQHLHNLVPPDSSFPDDDIEKQTWLRELRQTLSRLEREMEAETRRDLRAWLACPPPNDLFPEAKERRINGTCDWIIDRPEFVEWLALNEACKIVDDTERLLWVNGPAGFGKTVLCARIIEHLRSISQTPVVYFFLSSEFESRDNPYAAIRAWVHQMASSDQITYQLVREKWLAQNEQFATETEIVSIFREILQVVPGAILVLDGLDECTWLGKAPHDGKSLGRFLNTVIGAITNTASRLLVVSRDEPEIRSAMMCSKNCEELKIDSEDVKSDVARYARSIVDKKLPRKDEATREGVSKMLADRSNGQLLWVKLHEDSLRSWKNKKQLEDAINEIPSGLDHIYERNWTRISKLPEPIRKRAYSLLQWAAFALRPLTVNEISEAMLIDEEDFNFPEDELPDEVDDDFIESEIQSPCGSLLEVRGTSSDSNRGSRTVHLTHFSVKQHFLCNISSQSLSIRMNSQVLNELQQNSRLAKLCLRYINSQYFWDFEEKINSTVQMESTQEEKLQVSVKGSFRHYAASSWYQHSTVGYEEDEELTMLMMNLFDELNPSWETWRDLFEKYSVELGLGADSSTEPHHASPLHYAARLGFTELASCLIHDEKHHVNAKAPFGRTALEIAGNAGNLTLSKILLDAGADISMSNHTGSTPLIEASYNGAYEVIELLLDRGADCEKTSNYNWTALHVASYYGHLDVVALLLRRGANVTVANDGGWTPLNVASHCGHFDVIELLLDNGAEILTRSNDGWSPLNAASQFGHLDIVNLLLRKGADVHHANLSKWSSIHFASDGGHYEIVNMLLDAGADVAAVTNNSTTPLHIASSRGHLEVVELLLDNGADSNAVDDSQWTPIFLASSCGHEKVAKLLLSRCDDVSRANKAGMVPLYSASAAVNSKLAELLLSDSRNDGSLRAYAGWTLLHEASYNGRVGVIELLLAEGVDVGLTDERGWTPLHAAALSGHTEVAELLLQSPKCSTHVQDNSGRTPVFYASARGHYELIQILTTQNRLDLQITDQYGSTPLSAACRNGHEEAVKYLLSVDEGSFESRDGLGRSSMWWARKSGSTQVIESVLQHALMLKIHIPENNELGAQGANFDCDSAWCDICMTCTDEQAFYTCSLCDGGDFVICLECKDLGLECQDASHCWTFQEPYQEEGETDCF
ncbi:hypothetical protein CTAM01_12915 [Colletotrichum tamarilloi]|uniref:NACHT domain-containing protein n=1 Tax=Colletotrichum tamarilloi TaxID=1209934 RepID=A0ABQ9QTR8_9PEZI|nr:uncharacterized protein CTAM01_12915 [Colletotrichum tamarilloi]KAK1484671.1 hypothetical protein CTAM01_12915 [Colletotrichum tamarilloi]